MQPVSMWYPPFLPQMVARLQPSAILTTIPRDQSSTHFSSSIHSILTRAPMRKLTTDNPRLLAFHEAGHAVASWALTSEAPEVALVAYDPGMTAGRLQVAHFTLDGATRHEIRVPHGVAPVEGEPAQFSRETFEVEERRVIVLMAGVEAEAILTHDEDWWES